MLGVSTIIERIRQDERMFTNQSSLAGTTATLAFLVLSLGACESDQIGSDASAKPGDDAATATARPRNQVESGDSVQTEDSEAVISQMMAYTEDQDELVYGYFAAPADMFEPLPAIIMIHEWWGLNDHIRAMAKLLAAEGYIVFAVDLFRGKVATAPDKARVLMVEVLEDPESANRNLLAAYEFVSSTAGAPRVATIGWRFGGQWSLNAAQLLLDDLDACVIYYGQFSTDEDKLRPISSPILALFAAKDRSIKVEAVEAFDTALQHLRKNYEIKIYPGVGSGFANLTSPNFDNSAATDAWLRTLEFLELHLSIDDS